MIKYYHLKDGVTIAELRNAKYDCVNRIARVTGGTKSLCFDPSKYLMSNVFRAASKPHGTDVYDKEIGEQEAKRKVMAKYYRQLDRLSAEFVEDLNKAMFEASWRLIKNSENS